MHRVIQVALSVAICAAAAFAEVAAQEVRVETESLVVSGTGWTLQPLANGRKAFANREYVWSDLPRDTSAWRYTQIAGGEPAVVAVEARKDTTVYIASTVANPDARFAGWTSVAGVSFRYTDGGRTRLHVYARKLKTGECASLPQGTWAGSLLLLGLEIEGTLERLPYNNPGLEVDLGVGLWAWPLPMDADDDGDLDLVVSCPDQPYNGIYAFENPTGRTAPRA